MEQQTSIAVASSVQPGSRAAALDRDDPRRPPTRVAAEQQQPAEWRPEESPLGQTNTNSRVQPGSPRLVLLGSTGAGKSTSANYLLQSGHDVFTVQHGMTSCTHDIQVETSLRNGWCVVDKPGMSDVPVRFYGQSDKAYEAECRQRRVDFFTQVTGQLHDHGGVVLYVLPRGRLTAERQRHLKAVNLVLHRCFTSSMVLLLTNVPDMADIMQQRSYSAAMRNVLADPLQLATTEYMLLLSEARAAVERQTGLHFAAVLGACRPSAPAEHPAHPSRLAEQMHSLLSAAAGRQPVVGLAPGVAISWTDVVNGCWDKARSTETQSNGIEQTLASIKNTEANLDWLDKQTSACKTTKLMSLAAAGVVTAAMAFLGPLAAVAPVAGLAAAGTAKRFQISYESAQGDAVKTLDQLLKDLKQQRAELGQLGGQTPELLKGRAEEIERLVYG